MSRQRESGERSQPGIVGTVWLPCLAAILAWMFATGGLPAEDVRTINRMLATVDSLLVEGATDLAVERAEILQAAHGQDPLFGWQIAGRLGLALLRDGDPQAALPHLEIHVQNNPRSAVAHRNLAAALLALGRRGRAFTEYNVVVELAPGDFAARLEYGQVLLEFRDFAQAETHLLVADRLCGGCPDAKRGLANLYLAQGRHADAVNPLQVLAAAESSPQIRRLLVGALDQAGRFAEVLEQLDPIPRDQLDRDELRLLVQADAANASTGKLGPSREFAAWLAAPEAEVPVAVRQDAHFWAKVAANLQAAAAVQDIPLAEVLMVMDHAVALDPDNVVYRNNRVVVLLEMGRRDEAEAEWQRVLELDPSLGEKESP